MVVQTKKTAAVTTAGNDDGRNDEIARAINELRKSVDLSNREIARLRTALDKALSVLDSGSAQHGQSTSGLAAGEDTRKSINWVIGPPDNMGWAYGNNAKRLSAEMGDYVHRISDKESTDVAIYFDALVAQRYPVKARRQILRIGGPRPLDRLYGDDINALREGLSKFHAIIALNAELYLRASRVHSNVHLIPNALDLGVWSPKARQSRDDRPYTIGFAASLKSSAEAEVKGLAIAEGAAQRLGAKLLRTSKGKDQIAHDRMIPDFYSQIDVLMHPCGPGREGTSNVIMEAMALGLPVITTPHCGLHAELIVDEKNGLIRERDDLEFAEAVAMLQRDGQLARKIGSEARIFAQTHHDIKNAAAQFNAIIRSSFKPPDNVVRPRRKIAFVPFWEPMENFGSSRLRALYPSQYLASTNRYDIHTGYSEDADVVVVIQMCDDETLLRLKSMPSQFLIYDVCDKYYENGRIFKHLTPPVDSVERYNQLIDRADLVIVPTRELKAEVAARAPGKPVKYIAEPIDYGAQTKPVRSFEDRVVLWFGNPDRGNFESAKWILEHLRDHHGFRPLIVSRPSFFKKYPEFLPFCRAWSVEEMDEAFRNASLCVVSCDDTEQAKSPNRFIAATMQGLATLSYNSPACTDILQTTGHQFAILSTTGQIDKAITRLENDEFRDLYVRRVQRHLNQNFGREAVTEQYEDLLDNNSYDKTLFTSAPRKIAFVSHNLSQAEGAPWSLFELACALRSDDVIPYGYCPCPGPLQEKYSQAGIPLTIFDRQSRHAVKTLNNRFAAVRRAFQNYLVENQISAVVCNTVKTAPFADFAAELGIKSLIIVRESYDADERYAHFIGGARIAAVRGLTTAPKIVFVAKTSREKWQDQAFQGNVHIIPNGISPSRFADGAEQTKAEARQALGLPEKGLVALCVGTVNARKGQQQIMQAYRALPEAVREKSVIVFLGAVENSSLDGFRQAHGSLPEDIRMRIRVVEATHDVAPWYRASDIALMNSSSEAYPRSIVEALMFGLPVISTKVFGVTEQIEHEQSGLLYDFDDMESWSQFFEKLVIDDDYRAAMSTQAKRAFWKLTGHKEMALAYKSLLAGLIKT